MSSVKGRVGRSRCGVFTRLSRALNIVVCWSIFFFFSSRRRHTRSDRDWSSDVCFFFSSRRRHTRSDRDWSSDVCSSDLNLQYRLSEKDGGTLLTFHHTALGLILEDHRKGVTGGWKHIHEGVRKRAEASRLR